MVFPLKYPTRQGCTLLSSLLNTVLKGLSISVTQEEQTKGIKIGKEKTKLSLFITDIVVNIENTKEYTGSNDVLYLG